MWGWLVSPRTSLASSLAPIPRPDGKPWRLGYLQGGPYVEYPGQLRALAEALMDAGWIRRTDLPGAQPDTDTRAIWTALAERAGSEYMEFVPDAYWSSDWREEARMQTRREVLQRLTQTRDIDCMIAMGTWAGLDLRDGHSVPTMVMSTTNPIQAGVIDSASDSGRTHLHAKCDPKRYIRQIIAFHEIVPFQTVGVVAEDSPEGRVYACLPDLRAVARDQGFTVKVGWVPETNISDEQCAVLTRRAIAELAPRIDAFWIADTRGTQPEFLPDVLPPLLEHNIPTWTTLGELSVRRGVLFGTHEQDLTDIGRFHAKVLASILHGTPPREIPQIFEDPKKLLVNLQTARRIGFTVPPTILRAADRVFEIIETQPPANEQD